MIDTLLKCVAKLSPAGKPNRSATVSFFMKSMAMLSLISSMVLISLQ